MTRNEEVEAWYRANAAKIKKWANKRSKQDAEDILQDTAIACLIDPQKWEKMSKKLLTKKAMYKFYNPARGFKGEKTAELVSITALDGLSNPSDITEDLITKRSVEAIIELINTLSGASKDIFKMRFFLDMGYEEIALKLNMSHGSVKQLGSRAAKIISAKFKEKYG